MHYFKLETSDEHVRWINLDQVCRITLGNESTDVPILAIIFSDGNADDCLKIRGTDETNRRAIDMLTYALDSGHYGAAPDASQYGASDADSA